MKISLQRWTKNIFIIVFLSASPIWLLTLSIEAFSHCLIFFSFKELMHGLNSYISYFFQFLFSNYYFLPISLQIIIISELFYSFSSSSVAYLIYFHLFHNYLRQWIFLLNVLQLLFWIKLDNFYILWALKNKLWYRFWHNYFFLINSFYDQTFSYLRAKY